MQLGTRSDECGIFVTSAAFCADPSFIGSRIFAQKIAKITKMIIESKDVDLNDYVNPATCSPNRLRKFFGRPSWLMAAFVFTK
jgi:hypothetical protein